MKSKFLAGLMLSQVLSVGNAYAACYWQWEGINSHFVCDDDDGDSGSNLSVYTVNQATIFNESDYKVGFTITCGNGSQQNYQLDSGNYQELRCDASNSGVSSAMEVEFDHSIMDGYQSKKYAIGSTDEAKEYTFQSVGSEINLYNR